MRKCEEKRGERSQEHKLCLSFSPPNHSAFLSLLLLSTLLLLSARSPVTIAVIFRHLIRGILVVVAVIRALCLAARSSLLLLGCGLGALLFAPLLLTLVFIKAGLLILVVLLTLPLSAGSLGGAAGSLGRCRRMLLLTLLTRFLILMRFFLGGVVRGLGGVLGVSSVMLRAGLGRNDDMRS